LFFSEINSFVVLYCKLGDAQLVRVLDVIEDDLIGGELERKGRVRCGKEEGRLFWCVNPRTKSSLA
jgi:hypothetical protein